MRASEPQQRFGGQPAVMVRAAEAPGPGARIASGDRELQILVQRGGRGRRPRRVLVRSVARKLAEQQRAVRRIRGGRRAERGRCRGRARACRDTSAPAAGRDRARGSSQAHRLRTLAPPSVVIARRARVHDVAEARHQIGEHRKRQRPADAPAEVRSTPRRRSPARSSARRTRRCRRQIARARRRAVACDDRLEHAGEERVVAPRCAGARARGHRGSRLRAASPVTGSAWRVRDAGEHPPVVEQHERQRGCRAPRAISSAASMSREEMRIEPCGQAVVVVDDAAAAVAEHEPPRHREAEAAPSSRSRAATASRRVETPRCDPQTLAPKSRP